MIVEPNGVIGILGGGQLGRMLATAAAEIGLKTHILCPDDHAPAYDVSSAHTVAGYLDEYALAKFAKSVDVITYEFENVPVEAVEFLNNLGAVVRPGAKALETAQDRLVEKEFARGIGAETAAFHPVDDLDSLKAGLEKVSRPAILKTRRLGYDGKGQTRITTQDSDLSGAYEKAIEFAWDEVGAAPSILEGFVPFTREISIIGARGENGEIKLYDPAENVHKGGILRTSSVPAAVSEATAEKARAVTRKMLEALDYVGVIGVEFFVLENGDVIVNEYAPRVHNSGHWTEDGCAVSQFEQHIRAVAGWPLGDPARHSDAVMENLIGDDVKSWRALAGEPQTCVHLYGKREARPGRKMGHVTRITKKS
ncbi:5-(carboxyamino)imidazole ribonucleotide synthase [Hyphococcus luteus]|uniref:5-(carboxyamino)imidazole ribonucleotide synthase n=1 Tax=Hyphococcus luteus TaxID=2058213 RepID=UPI001A9CA9FC|nr:5-(carboxyamino)imidazole ribonucleotide synthase [Marinicaulis flavus]